MVTTKASEALRLQNAAVANFIKLNLSYRFTASIMDPEAETPTIRFLFSKPVERQPEPEVTVYLDLQVVEEKGSVWTYALFVEGQKYKRIISIDSKNIRGDELNEHLLDKVFKQKQVVRETHMWEPTA
jgi:hypothetical protein